MKLSLSVIPVAIFAPIVAGRVGPRETDRKLLDAPPTPLAPPGSYTNSLAKQDDNDPPTLDELNEIYGQFCDICEFQDLIEELLGVDAQYCDVCDVLIEIPTELPSLCFSDRATVQVQGVGNVPMKDLEIGANILAQSGRYEPMYAWGHKNPTKQAKFFQFHTKEAILEMTGGHLVFLDGKKNPVRADSIKVGDTLAGKEELVVKKIGIVSREGVYSPLTPSGTVVVDGILASSYVSLQNHSDEFLEFQGGVSTHLSFQDFIHMTLSPFRMLCMGISSRLGNVYTEDGIPVYASVGLNFARWTENQNIVVQVVLFLLVGALSGASMFVENTLGATYIPFAALIVGVVCYYMNGKTPTVGKKSKVI